MIRIKLLFWVFFLFAFQLCYSSSINADECRCIIVVDADEQTQFEKHNFIQNKFGEIPKSQLESNDGLFHAPCYIQNYNSKDFQSLIKLINYRLNTEKEESLSNTCNSRFINHIPLYLQTGKLRL